MSYRTAAIAAALAAAAASTVAPAAERTPASAPTSDASVSVKGNSDAPKRYCIRSTTPGAGAITGSLLSVSGCRTRAQWEARGVSLPKD